MKKYLVPVLFTMLALTPVMAHAKYPERSIELIVLANPGGDTDVNARALAAALNEEMGWNVIVTNMSGGSGAVAFEDALSNPDDGYRFVFYTRGKKDLPLVVCLRGICRGSNDSPSANLKSL